MVNKALLYGIVGFILGGILVSSAFALTDKTANNNSKVTTTAHNQSMTQQLASLKDDDFDKAFLAEMLNHHQGAIDMAVLIETNAKHSELKQLGKDIISAQSKEIDMMQTWQGDWGYKSVPESHSSH